MHSSTENDIKIKRYSVTAAYCFFIVLSGKFSFKYEILRLKYVLWSPLMIKINI